MGGLTPGPTYSNYCGWVGLSQQISLAYIPLTLPGLRIRYSSH